MKRIIIILFVIITLQSCEVEDNEHKYIQSVEITSLIDYEWDYLSSPDLQIFLRKASDMEWQYVTNRSDDNLYIPIYLIFEEEILATDETWIIQLIDYDYPDPDDIILEERFNPIEKGYLGSISLENTSVKIELNYEVK